MESPVVRAALPLLILIAAGFLSRKIGILKAGDERVLNAYTFYFALPALFLIDISTTKFDPQVQRFILVAIFPVIFVVVIFTFLYFIFKIEKSKIYLLILSTIFGNVAFFGIPFIIFAFPATDTEKLAVVASAFISMVAVTISITILEVYRLGNCPLWRGFFIVLKKLSKNPLIISIIAGIFLSLSGVKLPAFLSAALHMFGRTTATVAIFTLGVFLYGRSYKNIGFALRLSLLRLVFLPILAFLITRIFGMRGVEGGVITLMHGMPVAVSMIVLSQKYNFYREIIASLILLSTLFSILSLNLFLVFLAGSS